MPRGGFGQALEHDRVGRDVDHPLLVLEVEVVMVRGVGVEIGPRGVDRDFAQEARFLELVERVVDRRQRDVDARSLRLEVKLLGADVAMGAAEQQFGQCHALARRPQSGHPQHRREAGAAGGQRSQEPVGAGRPYVLVAGKRGGNLLGGSL